jgi:hypothetical protein
MGRSVIVAYKPKPGKSAGLFVAVARHLEVLRGEGLASDRPANVMRAADGTLLEVFEWKSAEAILEAHQNLAVQALWSEFADVCDYIPLSAVPETQQLFAEFETVEL